LLALRATGARAVLCLAAAGVGAGCVRHATLAECEVLLDRYVELLVRDRDPKADEGSVARQKSATREKAAHDPSFAACPKEVSAHAFDCAMAAPNADELEKCLE